MNPFDTITRTLWFCEDLTTSSSDIEDAPRHRVDKAEDGNLLSSLLDNGFHAPALDVDLPCELRPSSTEGHYHLLIDKQMSWRRYRRLLRALMRAGVIERGFYRHSVRRKQSFLRLPHVKK